jgi:hypothetical protein
MAGVARRRAKEVHRALNAVSKGRARADRSTVNVSQEDLVETLRTVDGPSTKRD